MRTGRTIMLAPLLLAACHAAKDDTSKTANIAAPIVDAHDAQSAAANAASAPTPPPGGVAPTESPADVAITPAFQGRWGLVSADCGPDASIAKGLLVINGAMLRFYEAVGKPTVISYPTPSRMEARFAFTGEGQDWHKEMVLELQGNNDVLVRTEKDPTAHYTYKRCPR